MASIYDHPEIYDLEHAHEEPDVSFFLSQLAKLRPKRTLDIACGTGRLSLPLALAATEWGGHVQGIDISKPMLDTAKDTNKSANLRYEWGDVRALCVDQPFDLVISACASLSHLLTLEDRLAAFKNVYASLNPGGRFILAEVAPDYSLLAESMVQPPRETIQFDGDFRDGDKRLLRYKSVRYHAHN